MSKITTVEKLNECYMPNEIVDAKSALGNIYAPVWQLREQCRIAAGMYVTVSIAGDDTLRFLHKSTAQPGMVAYTKNASKGEQDLQTVTTLEAYREKFGLVEPVPVRQCTDDERAALMDALRRQAAEQDMDDDCEEYDDLRFKLRLYFDAVDQMKKLKSELRGLVG